MCANCHEAIAQTYKKSVTEKYHIFDDGRYAIIRDASNNDVAIIKDQFLAHQITNYLNLCHQKGITDSKKGTKDLPEERGTEQQTTVPDTHT